MDAPWPRTWPEMAELHVFDPEGDVLLILERYQEDDLVESVDAEKGESVPGDGFLSEEPGPPKVHLLSADVPYWPELEPESVQCESQAETAGAELAGLEKLEGSTYTFFASQGTKPRVKKVQIQASSKHLILASPTFRTSLGSNTYPEGRTLQIEDNLVVLLLDKDPDIMIILLNIIHGLSSKVPRRVNLNILSKLAVAVNHRHIHETIGLWSDTWIENLKRDEGLPSSYTPEILLLWLFIFWVFRKDKDFRNIS